MTKATTDELWVLDEATDPKGFVPFARATIRLVREMEAKGWVEESLNQEVWRTTPEGRSVLQRHFACET